jgi:magnesium transporter
LIAIYKHAAGETTCVEQMDPRWLDPSSGVSVWVDLMNPTKEEARILTEVFRLHELSVEDAISDIHHPKIEPYPEYLYLILHGIDFRAREHLFRTQDVDFFLGANYLVTVHSAESRSIQRMSEVCRRNSQALGEGPAWLMHRIVDSMVDHYRPEVEKLSGRLDKLEKEVFQRVDPQLARRILDFKRDASSLRRVVLPQRDAVARLARREFPVISEALSFRFRDVYDHLVRLSDEAMFFHDRIGSLLEAHLSTVSNQLNSVMKLLTIIATLFMPLTVLTGMYGMNVELPHLPGGDAVQFWWVAGIMLAISVAMLWFFRTRKWI